jgi:hypothetical protein
MWEERKASVQLLTDDEARASKRTLVDLLQGGRTAWLRAPYFHQITPSLSGDLSKRNSSQRLKVIL